MPGRRMLRDMMSINDIYSYAETIIELLREEYGSYDADTLDEVQVEEQFAQRLEARGYDVRTDAEPARPAPEPARTVVEPVATGISHETPVVPVTVVRTRRATPNTTGGTTRTRRTTAAGDSTRAAPASETNRASAESARTAPAGESNTGSAPSPESSPASSETGRTTRPRRTTRTRSSSSNDGDAST